MKLEKAIFLETIHNDHNPNFTDAEREEAHQLSLEAMKRIKAKRHHYPHTLGKLLPGETEE